MVDFSKPVNNGDMVRGLNELVRRNQDLLAILDRLKGEDASVESLKSMHQQHLERLGETVRTLGGAPARRADWRRWAGESKMAIGKLGGRKSRLKALRAEELKLRDEYKARLGSLKFSPEAVDLLRELVAEDEEHLRQLETTRRHYH